jgi:hypothetical protein
MHSFWAVIRGGPLTIVQKRSKLPQYFNTATSKSGVTFVRRGRAYSAANPTPPPRRSGTLILLRNFPSEVTLAGRMRKTCARSSRLTQSPFHSFSSTYTNRPFTCATKQPSLLEEMLLGERLWAVLRLHGFIDLLPQLTEDLTRGFGDCDIFKVAWTPLLSDPFPDAHRITM